MKIPKAVQTDIMQRFMSEKAIKSFLSDYYENRRKGRGMGVAKPNDVDQKLYNKFKELKSMTLVADSFKCSTSRVASAVGRVVAWDN